MSADVSRDRLADGPWDRSFWSGQVSSRVPALLRIGLAALLLGDSLMATPQLDVLYGPDGVWPARLGSGLLTYASTTGLHVAWALGCLALFALTLGLFTRTAAFASVVFLVSVHQRNPAITTGGDSFAQILVLLMIFLDSGAAYSLDARLRGRGRAYIPAAPWRAMQLHLALLYLFAAMHKVRGGWLSGDGVYMSLQHNGFLRPPGLFMLEHPALARASTWMVLGLEASFAFLAFCPWYGRQTRLLAAATGLAVQLGVFLTMRVGVFTPIMLWVNLLFFPVAVRAAETPYLARRGAMFAGAICGLILVLPLQWRLRLDKPLAAIGLMQQYDLFGRTWEVAEWYARAKTSATGREVDVLPEAARGLRPPLGWRFETLYKLTFSDAVDHTAVARWLCRAHQQETGEALSTIRLWKRSHAPVRPGEEQPFVETLLYEGPCSSAATASSR